MLFGSHSEKGPRIVAMYVVFGAQVGGRCAEWPFEVSAHRAAPWRGTEETPLTTVPSLLNNPGITNAMVVCPRTSRLSTIADRSTRELRCQPHPSPRRGWFRFSRHS
jgi:hypothetical protein